MSTPEEDCENGIRRGVGEWAELYGPIPALEAAMMVAQIYARGRAAEILVTTEITGVSRLEWATRAGDDLGANYLDNTCKPGWYIYAVREQRVRP